ncbi:MAG: prepilin-type N-terminal cleavage/methylation domain-containing protein [bacterium]
MIRKINNMHGFTLIELVIVILIIGVIGTVATLRMQESIETARYEQTKQEMDQLAIAIVGNPRIYSNGANTDFGFVGDNGALPTTLDELTQNPGGWSTWDGPYVESGPNGDEFKKDAWLNNYLYTDTLLRSTGSGTTIDKLIAVSSAALLSNVVSGYVVDADMEPPSAGFVDSVTVVLTYPNGSGGLAQPAIHPDAHGRFSYTGVPVGNHSLQVIHEPTSDTMAYSVTVYPERNISLDIVFPADLW